MYLLAYDILCFISTESVPSHDRFHVGYRNSGNLPPSSQTYMIMSTRIGILIAITVCRIPATSAKKELLRNHIEAKPNSVCRR